MGLDAVVYTNVKNLDRDGALETSRVVDRLTGEVYFEDDNVARRYPPETFQAINLRLGNVSALGEILKEISQVIPADGILRSRILKSFSHSGDVIGGDELEKLDHEVQLTRTLTTGVRSVALTEFLGTLEQLIKTAREQENPIVFV